MSLGECPKCFELICSCGYAYTGMTDSEFYNFVITITSGRKQFIGEMAKDETIWSEEDFTIKMKGEPYSCECGSSTFKKHYDGVTYRCNQCMSIHEAG